MTSWTSPGYGLVADLVRERTGLVFPDARVVDVEETIRRTMARRGIDSLARLASLLREDEAAREAFVAELTIGESYFERDPGQIELLRSRILPDLLSRRPANRPLRIWSAGCASGEEPYTIAMLFDQMGMLDRCDIVGTDIARSRLEHAQRGLYSNWALRNSDAAVRSRYFTTRGRFHELTPRLRSRVDFRYLNLAEDLYPSLSTGVWGMDIILCRNVLIYFDAPTVELVAQRLIASLSDDGWLVLGASDPAISEMVDCDVVLTDAGLAYRRASAAGDSDVRRARPTTVPEPAWWTRAPGAEADDVAFDVDPAEPPSQDTASSPTAALDEPAAAVPAPAESAAGSSGAAADEATADEAIAEAYARRDFDAVSARATRAEGAGTIGERGWTAWLRALANQGCLDEAGQVATRAMAIHGSSAELLYLHAVLLLQAGMPAEAAGAARRSLYLDRRLVVAHLTLAEAHRRTGMIDAAGRALRNAAALLADMDATAEVPGSDGESAGRLAEMVRVKERLLVEAT